VRRGGASQAPAWQEGAHGLTLRLPPREAPPDDPRGRDRATLDVPLPERAVIHLPCSWNAGTRIDRDMPAGESYRAGLNFFGLLWLAYPLVLVDLGPDGWLEIAARAPLEAVGTDRGGGGLLEHVTPRRPSAAVRRTGDGFLLCFEWAAEDPLTVQYWPTMDAAVASHHAWLRQTYGLRSLAEQVAAGDVPAWVLEIPIVFTFDLWRPHGEVAHTYTHLRDLARELKELGVPPGALFYLPGWCAPYDRGYPDYVPAPELGGRAGFREAIDALHDGGYRAMVHTLAWGADPYRPGFDRLAHLAVRAQPHHPRDRLCGPYVGWPGGAPARPLDFRTGREPLRNVRPAAGGWSFETVPLPQTCQAVLTLGGLPWVGDGIIRLTLNGRTLVTLPQWFRHHDRYRFPFPFLFRQGVNVVQVECFGCPANAGGEEGTLPDLHGGWYAVADAVQFTGAWTAPIVGMDVDSPQWHDAYLAQLAPTVEEFGIDAVHVDASLLWRWDEAGFFAAVRRRLPRIVFSTEVVTAAGMRFFTLGQGGQIAGEEPQAAWASKPSDLPWRLTGKYMRLYQHLCAPRGFVPAGSSCNIRPVARALPEGEAGRLWAQLERGRERHVLYNLRVNYRDYGLDDGTRRFLLERVVAGVV
jgi:hypothetical protein